MSNPRQSVLDQGFAKPIGYGENTLRHKTKNGTWVGNGFMVFDARYSRERHLQGSEP